MISKFMSAVITSNALSFQCPCGGAGHIRVDIQVLFLSKALHIMYSTAQHLKLVYRFCIYYHVHQWLYWQLLSNNQATPIMICVIYG